jgi:hypothetical protein
VKRGRRSKSVQKFEFNYLDSFSGTFLERGLLCGLLSLGGKYGMATLDTRPLNGAIRRDSYFNPHSFPRDSVCSSQELDDRRKICDRWHRGALLELDSHCRHTESPSWLGKQIPEVAFRGPQELDEASVSESASAVAKVLECRARRFRRC